MRRLFRQISFIAATALVTACGGEIEIESPVDSVGTGSPSEPTVPSGNTKPVANFTYEISGSTIYLDAGTSSDPDGDNISFEWYLGAGIAVSDVVTAVTYSNQGTYTVLLIVTDENNNIDTYERVFVVDSSMTARPAGENSTPTPAPTVNPQLINGQALYASLSQGCQTCHGADGQSTTFKAIDPTLDFYVHSATGDAQYTLEEYITQLMPPGNESVCNSSCSEDIAAYIRSWVQSPAEPTPAPEPSVTPIVITPTLTPTPSTVPTMTPSPIPIPTTEPSVSIRIVSKDGLGTSPIASRTSPVIAEVRQGVSLNLSGYQYVDIEAIPENDEDLGAITFALTLNETQVFTDLDPGYFLNGDGGYFDLAAGDFPAGNYRLAVYLTNNNDEDIAAAFANFVVLDGNNGNLPPEADASASANLSGVAPHTVNFSSVESVDDRGIAGVIWSFGDGSSNASGQVVQHVYTNPGTYTASLTVIDSGGLSDREDIIVTVTAPTPTPTLTPTPTSQPTPTPTPGFVAADFYQNHCALCHGVNGGGTPPANPALTQAWELPALVPDVARMVGLYGGIGCLSLDDATCSAEVAAYIFEEFNTIEPDDPPLNACLDFDEHLISAPIKALTQREFFNTIDDVFGVAFSKTEQENFNLPLENTAGIYSTNANMRVLRGISSAPTVLDDLYPALTSVVEALTATLTNQNFDSIYGAVAGCAFSNVASSESCRNNYRAAILSKAFRRSVATNDAAVATADAAYDIFIDQGLSPRDAFIESIATYAVFSPEFIYHSYRGEEASEGFQLSNYELAHKIAYMIWGAPADNTTLALNWNSLLAGENDAQLDAELLRLFRDSRSKYFVDTFLDEWLGLDLDVAQELNSTSDNARAQEFADAVKAESEHFIRYLIEQNETVNTVINANYTFMNAALADFYQVNVPGLGSNFERVDFADIPALNNRQGLLTQANFLTTGTKSDRPGTVHRGVTVLTKVMCHAIGPPSGETPDIGDIDRTQHTEAALFRTVTETPGSACLGCHQNINPVSFPFEAFDRFGRHPLALANAQGSLPEYAVYEAVGVDGNPDANGPVEKAATFYLDERGGSIDFDTYHGHAITGSFDNHQGLISLLDESPAFSECINDNLYDFIIGTTAEKGLNPTSSEFDAQHQSQTCSKQVALNGVNGIRTLITNLIKRPEFRVIQRD